MAGHKDAAGMRSSQSRKGAEASVLDSASIETTLASSR